VEPIVVDRESGLMTITLNRPERKNALNAEAWILLDEALGDAALDPEVRALLLTGADGNFSAGADLSGENPSGNGLTGRPVQPVVQEMRVVGDMILRLQRMAKPAIAKVDGVAVGVAHAAVERHAQEVLVGAELLVRHDTRGPLEHGRPEQRVPRLLEAGGERRGAAADVRDADRGRRFELELQLADRTEQAIRSIIPTASTGYCPIADSADSITASAPSNTAVATSDTSARVGIAFVIMDSSIWVATTTGFPARRAARIICF